MFTHPACRLTIKSQLMLCNAVVRISDWTAIQARTVEPDNFFECGCFALKFLISNSFSKFT